MFCVAQCIIGYVLVTCEKTIKYRGSWLVVVSLVCCMLNTCRYCNAYYVLKGFGMGLETGQGAGGEVL